MFRINSNVYSNATHDLRENEATSSQSSLSSNNNFANQFVGAMAGYNYTQETLSLSRFADFMPDIYENILNRLNVRSVVAVSQANKLLNVTAEKTLTLYKNCAVLAKSLNRHDDLKTINILKFFDQEKILDDSELKQLFKNTYVDIDIKDAQGENILIRTVKASGASERIENIKLLLKAGANANIFSSNAKPLLQIALLDDSFTIPNLLIGYGADIEAKNDSGETALIYAVSLTSEPALEIDLIDQVRELLELNADVNAQDNEGNTALHYAAMGGNGVLIDCLLARNPNYFISNNHGKSSFDILIEMANQFIDDPML